MSEDSEDFYIFEEADMFADFLEENAGGALKRLKDDLPHLVNFILLRKAMAKKPCACGGADPDGVMRQRKSMFNNFYKGTVDRLLPEHQEKIKEVALEYYPEFSGIVFKHKGEIVLTVD